MLNTGIQIPLLKLAILKLKILVNLKEIRHGWKIFKEYCVP
jgi:hypothetical protein